MGVVGTSWLHRIAATGPQHFVEVRALGWGRHLAWPWRDSRSGDHNGSHNGTPELELT